MELECKHLAHVHQLQLHVSVLIVQFLSERKQQVVNGSSSDALPVLLGVPQGPVIGPLLFLIYIDGIKSITFTSNVVRR